MDPESRDGRPPRSARGDQPRGTADPPWAEGGLGLSTGAPDLEIDMVDNQIFFN